MTFREYLTVTGTELPDAAAPVSPDLLQSSDARAIVDSLAPLVDTLDLAWQRYLEVGGFPRAVADATTTGAVSNTLVGDLTGWLVGDVDPDAPAESVVGLLAAIEQGTASPFEVTSAAEALGTTRSGSVPGVRMSLLGSTEFEVECGERAPEVGQFDLASLRRGNDASASNFGAIGKPAGEALPPHREFRGDGGECIVEVEVDERIDVSGGPSVRAKAEFHAGATFESDGWLRPRSSRQAW